MERLRAGMSAVITLVVLLAPAGSAIWVDAGHTMCAIQRHACGHIPQISVCCCRHSGSASEPNGPVPSTQRADGGAAPSIGGPLVPQLAATEALSVRVAAVHSSGPPNLVILFSNLRI